VLLKVWCLATFGQQYAEDIMEVFTNIA